MSNVSNTKKQSKEENSQVGTFIVSNKRWNWLWWLIVYSAHLNQSSFVFPLFLWSQYISKERRQTWMLLHCEVSRPEVVCLLSKLCTW